MDDLTDKVDDLQYTLKELRLEKTLLEGQCNDDSYLDDIRMKLFLDYCDAHVNNKIELKEYIGELREFVGI